MTLSSGAKAAVPPLLALNVLVSAIGLYGFRPKLTAAVLGQSLAGGLVGIVIGAWTFPYLPERFVVLAMAIALFGGSASGRSTSRRRGWKVIAGAGATSGLATAWTATPGPIMALGLIRAGYEGTVVRRLVQPISFITYSAALGLLGRSAWRTVTVTQHILPVVVATVLGGTAGLVIGPRIPSRVVVPAIRILAAVAGFILLWRAVVG